MHTGAEKKSTCDIRNYELIKMIQAYSLYEGSFSVDASKVFVPFDPAKDDPLSRKGSLFVHVHPFLIVAEDGLILPCHLPQHIVNDSPKYSQIGVYPWRC